MAILSKERRNPEHGVPPFLWVSWYSATVYRHDERQPASDRREAVALWLESPTHRANLLSPLYQATAVGVIPGTNETLFITQNFSRHAAEALAAR